MTILLLTPRSLENLIMASNSCRAFLMSLPASLFLLIIGLYAEPVIENKIHINERGKAKFQELGYKILEEIFHLKVQIFLVFDLTEKSQN